MRGIWRGQQPTIADLKAWHIVHVRLPSSLGTGLGLASKLQERFRDELEGLALDLAMHLAAAPQAELLRDLGDGDSLSGQLQIGRHVADATVFKALQFP